MHSWIRRQAGQAIVLVAITVVVLTAILALALDGGSIYLDRRQLQNAADATALAGAELLMTMPINDAAMHNQAISTLLKNLPGTSSGGTVCASACPSQPTIGAPAGPGQVGTLQLGSNYYAELSITTSYTYQVTLWHIHPVVVAPIHGFSPTMTLTTQATAQNANLPYAVVLLQNLDPTFANLKTNGGPSGLQLTGGGGALDRGGVFSNASIDPGAGTVAFSPSPGTACPPGVGNSGDLTAYSPQVHLGPPTVTCAQNYSAAQYPLLAGGQLSMPTYPEPPAMTDPAHTYPSGSTVSSGTVYLCPGTYGDAINVTGGTAVLFPGVYHVKAGGVKTAGILRTLQAGAPPTGDAFPVTGANCPTTYSSVPADTGVIIEITPQNDSTQAVVCSKHQFVTSGTGSINLAPSPRYFNINVYVDVMPNWQTICGQQPKGTNVVSITGGGTYSIGGILYGPADNMKVNGGGGGSGVGQIVAWTLTTGGNGLVNELFNPNQLPYMKGLIQ